MTRKSGVRNAKADIRPSKEMLGATAPSPAAAKSNEQEMCAQLVKSFRFFKANEDKSVAVIELVTGAGPNYLALKRDACLTLARALLEQIDPNMLHVVLPSKSDSKTATPSHDRPLQ